MRLTPQDNGFPRQSADWIGMTGFSLPASVGSGAVVIDILVIANQSADISALRAAFGGCAPKRACGRSGVAIRISGIRRMPTPKGRC